MPTQRHADEHRGNDERGDALAARHRYGSTGTRAPEAKKQKLDTAARKPVPTASCSADSVASGRLPGHRRRAVWLSTSSARLGGFGLAHAARPVDQGELVGVDVEVGQGGSRLRIGAEASSSSRCERTDTYSPAPIDSAPASSPASR